MPRRRSESHRTSRHPRPARPSATPAQDQREQLLTQAARLERHCREAGFAHVEVATDLDRGLNYRKSGLQRILVDIRRVRVSRLVVVTRDLLLRFGSELLFQICRFFGVEVVVSMLLQGFPVSSSSPRRDSHRLLFAPLRLAQPGARFMQRTGVWCASNGSQPVARPRRQASAPLVEALRLRPPAGTTVRLAPF